MDLFIFLAVVSKLPLESFERSKIMSNKENIYRQTQKGKLIELKSNVERKIGLSLNAETHAFTTHTLVEKSSFRTALFKVHCDDELDYSRSLPRKHVSRKEIEEKQGNEATERRSTASTMEILERKKDVAVTHCRGPHRSRSSTNWNRVVEKSRAANSHRRAHSETRKILSTDSVTTSKPRSLSNDVKKRTYSSIEMWKEKMRKRDIAPKSCSNKPSCGLNADRGNTKIKLQETPIADNCSKIYEKSCVPSSNTLSAGVSQSTTIYSQKRSQKLAVAASSTASSHLSNKVTSQDSSFSSVQDSVSVEAVTSSHSSAAGRLMNEVKDCYRKCTKEYDYLEDTPDAERMREESAPSLSSRFLRESVNAEQRKIIVGYLIHLGTHCSYSSHIIYQTVKLFDLAIDRIVVTTDNIQLMALACLWITLKREATGEVPTARTILRLAKDLYVNQEKHLLMFEKEVLLALKFNIRFADPYSLLFYYIKSVRSHVFNSTDIPCIYICSSYLIDLSLLDENLCDISESIRALAAVDLSLFFIYLNDTNVTQAYHEFLKRQNFAQWEKRALKFTKKTLISHLIKSDNENSHLNVVYKKYLSYRFQTSNPNHNNISTFFLAKTKKFLQKMQ